MSKTVSQIFATNPTTVVADTDLYYLVQSPYTPGADAAITGASLKAAFGSGGTINVGAANQIAYYAAPGATLSGTSTIPSAVQDNITRLGTISSIGSPLGGTFGGTGVNNGISTITIGGNFAMSGAFTFTGTLTGNTGVTFPTSGTLATTAQLPTPSALTRVDDTNVTLTLGGTPSTALLQAVSLTLGWTGTLDGTRGGTGVNNGVNTATFAGNLNFASDFTTSGAFAVTQTYTGITNVTFPTSGTLATTAQITTSPLTTKGDLWGFSTVDDRLPVGTINGQILQVNSGATLGLSYSTATYPSTANNAARILRSDGTNYVDSTSTFADIYAASSILYSNGASNVAGLATANNGILVTSGTGVPSIGNTVGAGLTMPSITFNSTTGVVGTTTNDNAAAGSVGQYIESIVLVGSAVSLTSLVAANITSISLTAGDWDVWGEVWFDANTTTVASSVAGSINTASATFPTVPAAGTSVSCIYFTGIAQASAGVEYTVPVNACRATLSGTTTYYLNARSGFATSTMTAYGKLCARRRR